MTDWAIEYIRHVLETRDWSANRLATEAGLAASTIGRPLREPDYPHNISRATISKIWAASGVDPGPFVPNGMREDGAIYQPSQPPKTLAGRSLAAMDADQGDQGEPAVPANHIRIVLDGNRAQISAIIDKDGIADLRRRIDAIAELLKE